MVRCERPLRAQRRGRLLRMMKHIRHRTCRRAPKVEGVLMQVAGALARQRVGRAVLVGRPHLTVDGQSHRGAVIRGGRHLAETYRHCHGVRPAARDGD
eukprot:2725645-Prymnesium_polylepis.2